MGHDVVLKHLFCSLDALACRYIPDGFIGLFVEVTGPVSNRKVLLQGLVELGSSERKILLFLKIKREFTLAPGSRKNYTHSKLILIENSNN